MKFKRTFFLTAVVVAMGLLLGAAAAQAEPSVETEGNWVTAIRDLPIGGAVYDVRFKFGLVEQIYGASPVYDFTTQEEACAAVTPVNLALTTLQGGWQLVGPPGGPTRERYLVPYGNDELFAHACPGRYIPQGSFWRALAAESTPLQEDPRVFAVFTLLGEVSGNQAPSADAGGPYEGVAGAAVQFDGSGSSDPENSSLTYTWNFGDPNDPTQGTGPTPSHTYSDAAVYNVTLTVTDDSGDPNTGVASETTDANITAASLPPVADAGGPYTGTVDVPVTFDGAGSSDPDGAPVGWSWDFGDDSEPGSGPDPTHSYTAAGIYGVTLTVTDDSSETAFDSTTATIGRGNQAPVADAGGPYTGAAGTAVFFDGTGSDDPDGDIRRYFWDFGDDSKLGKGETPSHVYSAGGVYFVTLQVKDDDRVTSSDSTVANIGSDDLPPMADAGGPYAGTAGEPVEFDGSNSTGRIASRSWNFGDSTPSQSGEMPTHTYEESGIYQVDLFITYFGGETASDRTVALIGVGNHAPVADAGGPYEGEVDVEIFFDGSGSSDRDGIIVDRDWNFGDNTFAQSGETTTHTYTEPGFYSVTHYVTDNSGASDADSTIVLIRGPEDNRSPDCSGAVPSIDTLQKVKKKGKNKLIPVDVEGVTDPDGDAVSISIASIFQDEPVGREPDGSGVGGDTAFVRDEKEKKGGNGRVYHIGFTADDGLGGICKGEVLVGVPLTKRGEAVDDGANFDSTVPSF